METKEQKVDRLKKEYWILKEEIDKRFTRETKLEERIRHLKKISVEVGDIYTHTDKTMPNSLQIAETELEELKQERFKLFDLRLKVEQELKELEKGNEKEKI